MIQAIIQAFQQGGLDWTDAEIADAVWLASYIDLPSTQNFVSNQYLRNLRANDSVRESIWQPTQPSKIESDNAPKAEVVAKPNQPTAEIHLPQPKFEANEYIGGVRSVAFQAPATTALPGKLAIARSLRPLLRRVSSRTNLILDEEATVQSIAEGQSLSPVSKPGKERWLDLAIVVDDWETMLIWRETVAEFMELLQQIGAFRTIQTYRLSTELRPIGAGGKREVAQLYTTSSSNDALGRACNPKELLSAQGHRLILIASDCTAPIWSNGALGKLIRVWGENNIVALIQMLPISLWEGCALANSQQVYLSPQPYGQSNSTLVPEPSWNLHSYTKPAGYALPVFTLEPDSIAVWSKFLIGKTGVQVPGFCLPTDLTLNVESNTESDGTPPSGEHLVQQFRAIASPIARELAGYLAAAPLNLPVMRLVQRLMLPQSRQVHLAEVFRSGLIAQVAKASRPDGLEEALYDYVEDTRRHLLSTVSQKDALKVVQRVSEFVSKQSEQLRKFHALLLDPTLPGDFTLDDNSIALATIAVEVLYRFGSHYSQLAQRLQTQISEHYYTKFMSLLGYEPQNQGQRIHLIYFWLPIPLQVGHGTLEIPAQTTVSTQYEPNSPEVISQTVLQFLIQPPILNSVILSRYDDRASHFRDNNVEISILMEGVQSLNVFSEIPQPDDALYFSFDNNLSHHILQLDLRVEITAGIGIRGDMSPPYVWETFSDNEWVACLAEDNSMGLNRDDSIRIYLPKMSQTIVSEHEGYWLRIRLRELTQQDIQLGMYPYVRSPRLRQIISIGTVGCSIPSSVTNISTLKQSINHQNSSAWSGTIDVRSLPNGVTSAKQLHVNIPEAVWRSLNSTYIEEIEQLQKQQQKMREQREFLKRRTKTITIISKAGHQVVLDDSRGTIALKTRGGQTLLLDELNGTIAIESPGDIEIKAANTINFEGSNINIEAAQINVEGAIVNQTSYSMLLIQGSIVNINSGQPAARLGDPTVHGGVIVMGYPTVLIGGQPAARMSDMHTCPMINGLVPHVGGPISLGSGTVLIGGMPAARVGDMATCVGAPDSIAIGCSTVLIGG